MIYPDYNNSLVNIACSVIHHFGGEIKHETFKPLDDLLQKGYKNIIVMLFDGLGVDALEHHLPQNSFLRKHYVREISSVFPPTTTAATTSVESGRTPIEHGWLGWSLYFKEIDKIVDVFPNTIKDSDRIQAASFHVGSKYIPYKNIVESINETGNGKAYIVSEFGNYKIHSQGELFQSVIKLSKEEGKKYIYTYYHQPDSIMHTKGCYSDYVKDIIEDINERVEKLCNKLEDSLIILTADHGHINNKYKFISDYPELLETLIRPTSIESRATAFYVKEGYNEKFLKEFKKAFKDDFILLSKEDVLEKKLFGEGVPNIKSNGFLGDYLAIAISDVSIAYSHGSNQFVSNHAGLTEKEMLIPYIVVEKRSKF